MLSKCIAAQMFSPLLVLSKLEHLTFKYLTIGPDQTNRWHKRICQIPQNMSFMILF